MTDELFEDANFEELVGLAGKELTRRFRENPDSLPGTFVIKLFLDGNKAMRAGEVAEQEEAPPEPDILELITNPGLPPERRHELALQERELLRAKIELLDQIIEGDS